MSRQQESPDNYMDDSIRSVESDKVRMNRKIIPMYF